MPALFPTRLIGALNRADELLLAALRVVLIVLMTLMASSVLLQVFTRYVLTFSLTWSEELARLCLICLIFLGAAILCRREEHLAVTTIVAILPFRLRSISFAAANLVGLYCSWYLVHGSFRALNREWAQLTPAMQIPMGLVYSTAFVGIVLMIIWLFANFLRHMHAAVSGTAE